MNPQSTAVAQLPLLSGTGIAKCYRPKATLLPGARTTAHWAVGTADGGTVNVTVHRGESVAIVGASGSGKSTLLGMLLGLGTPTSGEVRFDGRLVFPRARNERLRWLRHRTGIMFQDPYSTFDPRRTIAQTVAEPLAAAAFPAADHHAMVRAMLDRMNLPADAADRYPHEFSGGQRQRIALARALVHQPELLVADEPVSAVDVLVRARLLELLAELRTDLGLTLLTVTHDLAVVPHLAERVLVMDGGMIVESGTVAEVFEQPRTAYTRELMAARPRLR